ncbi:MAG: hypothetical protein BroJett018_25820 [Chloroflexota bacterium]|nr:MAG: hypothetical protein BroJett018_25820 [Chloroflexota bacterium]
MFRWCGVWVIVIGMTFGLGLSSHPAHQPTLPTLIMALRQDADRHGVYRVDPEADQWVELIPPLYDQIQSNGWSPDGDWLYLLVCSWQLDIPCGGMGDDYGQTWRVAADGSYAEQLPIPLSAGITWSPDGQWIVFLGADGLYRAHGDGSALLNLTADEGVHPLGGGSWATWRPVFSPDSRRVLFTAYDDITHDVALYWADLTGTEGIGKISRGDRWLWATAWPADEWLVVNTGDRYASYMRMRADGSAIYELSEWSDGGDIYASPLLILPDGLIELPDFLLVGNVNPYDNEDDTLSGVRLQDGATLWTIPATTYLSMTPDHWLLFLHDSGHFFKMRLDGSQLTPLATIPPRVGPYVEYIDWLPYGDGGVFAYRNHETSSTEYYYLRADDIPQPLTLLYQTPNYHKVLETIPDTESLLIGEYQKARLVMRQISTSDGAIETIAEFSDRDDFLAVAQTSHP